MVGSGQNPSNRHLFSQQQHPPTGHQYHHPLPPSPIHADCLSLSLPTRRLRLSGAKMSETNPEFPSQVTYTVAVPIRSVAPITQPPNNNKKKKNIPKTPSKSKSKPSISKKSKKKTVLKPNVERKNLDLETSFDESKFDFSKVPPPVCCCTGVPRQCHKCGVSGWQSSCCNSKMSVFPLPMSPWRPGARVTGRKMSHGAYRKLLCKLANEGHDLSKPIDLKPHWAKHGTNNFVTIK